MDTLLKYRGIVKELLLDYAKLKPAYGEFDSRVIFDDERGSYALLEFGWLNKGRVHDSLIHIDIIEDKVWIQQDSTEDGIALELVAAGIPKDQIVLGFRAEKVRLHTEFAVH